MITVIPWIVILLIAYFGATANHKTHPDVTWGFFFAGQFIVWGGLWLICMWMSRGALNFMEG